MKLLLCDKCDGEFGKDRFGKTNIEYVDDKPHHPYCADVVIKKKLAQQKVERQANPVRNFWLSLWETFPLAR